MKAVAYLRVSTDDQRLGPEAQLESIRRWASANGAEVVSVHCDQGVSGGTELADRPGLLDALGALGELYRSAAPSARRLAGRKLAHGPAAAQQPCLVLVVAKRDRLARDVIVSAMVERECARVGAVVVAADGAGNGDGPEALLMKRMVDAFAEYERALIRARTRAALRALKARGERAGTVPFGSLADDAGRLTPNDSESATLEAACGLRRSGMALRGIVAELERSGHRGRTGRPYRLTQVARMVQGVECFEDVKEAAE